MADNIPELKPCPFCGGEATIRERMDENLWDHSQVKWLSVSCNNLDCEAQGFDWPEEAEPNAVELWNTRAAPKVKPLIRRPCNGGEVAESVFGDVVFSFDGEWVDEQMNQTIQVDMPWEDCEVFSNLDEADDWADEMIAARILSALQ